MNDIKKLETIGLKEVSRKTYIEVQYLKLIIAKDFANLNHKNVLGYVKIIKREFGIDFDAWLLEYQEFKKLNIGEQENKTFIDNKPKSYSSKTNKILVLSAVFILGFVAYIFIQSKTNNLNLDENSLTINSPYAHYENSSILQEAKESINNIAKVDAIYENETSNISSNSNINMNSSIHEEQNHANVAVVIHEDQNTTNTTFVREETKALQVLQIVPTSKMWVGVINTKTRKREVFSQIEPIDILLNDEKLVLTGHGYFDIKDLNHVIKKYRSQDAKYFNVTNSTINEVSVDEFRELNRGKLW